MQSEAVIDELLQWFLALGAADEEVLLGLLDNDGDASGMLKFYTVLIPLLNHPNSDIGNDVVAVLHELFYEEEAFVDGDFVRCLAQIARRCMVQADLFGLFYVHLNNLMALEARADMDDYQAVYQIMQIIESLLEMNSFLSDEQFTVSFYAKLEQSMLIALFASLMKQDPKAVAEQPFSATMPPADYANRLFATELTSTLVQVTTMDLASDSGQVASAAASLLRHATEAVAMIELVLVSVSPYHGRDPSDSDEQEYLFNLFDILGALLLKFPPARQSFIGKLCQGFELMLLMLKGLNIARIRAIQLVDYALAGGEESVAVKFMDVGGIKLLGPILMGKGSAALLKSYPKLVKSPDQDETHACSILASLFNFIPKNSTAYFRLLAKFAESSGDKFLRLVELHEKYEQKVALFNKLHDRPVDGTDDTEWVLDVLNSGMFTLQAVDTCLLMLTHSQNLWDSIPKDDIDDELVAAVKHEASARFILDSKVSDQVNANVRFMLSHSPKGAPHLELLRQFSDK